MRISDWSSDVCSSDLVTGSNYAPGSGLAPQAPQGERVLVYGDLKSVKPYAEYRAPDREIVLKLTGNMERYFWSINGKKYSEAKPIRLHYGERVRFKFVNETRSEEHTSELQSLMRISYAVFCLKKKSKTTK